MRESKRVIAKQAGSGAQDFSVFGGGGQGPPSCIVCMHCVHALFACAEVGEMETRSRCVVWSAGGASEMTAANNDGTFGLHDNITDAGL